MHVYGDRYADLLAGQPALPRHAVPEVQIGVVHVGLVYPGQVAKDDAVLVAVDGGHHAVAPLPCRLVGYAQLLGQGVEGHVGSHEANESVPGRHVEFGPSGIVSTGDVSLAQRSRQRQRRAPPAVLSPLKGETARQRDKAGSVR